MKKNILYTPLLVCCCNLAIAETVFIEATQDNTLYESPSGLFSNGAGDHLFVGLTNDLRKRRAVIAFKDLSAIPQDAPVTSVNLHLHLSKEDSDITTINLVRLTADWGEGASHAADNEGRGANSEPGDATWIHRFWSTFTWFNPGGDFAAAPSAEQFFDAVGGYSFDSTQAMVSDVREWLDNANRNFGWILIGDETTRSAKRFDSRDNSDPFSHPILEVQYTTTGTSFDYSGPLVEPSWDGE